MATIKSFNEILNQSDPLRFESWKTYRKKITTSVVTSFGDAPNELLIIGAGNCDDLDLNVLSETFGKLYLSDIDEKALQSAVTKYQIEKEKVRLLPTEYTGIAGHIEWKDFVTEAVKIKHDKDVRTLMKKYKQLILAHTFLPNYERQFKRIIISPIYTQLLFPQLQANLQTLENLNYNQHLIDFIRRSFLNLMTVLIDTFNKNVIKLLAQDGQIIAISDIYETKNGSDFLKNVKTIVSDNEKMDSFYQRYQRDYSTGLGDYGLINMDKKLKPTPIIWVLWPFSDKRTMVVKMVSYQKR